MAVSASNQMAGQMVVACLPELLLLLPTTPSEACGGPPEIIVPENQSFPNSKEILSEAGFFKARQDIKLKLKEKTEAKD